MFGFQASRLPELAFTAAASLRATPFTSPKWPPMYTDEPANAIVNTTGAQRGGQAKPPTWPTRTSHGSTPPSAVSCARWIREMPPMRVNLPPANTWLFGDTRTTYTGPFAPGFQGERTPAVVTAPMWERACPASFVNRPPT